jgi:hypothetical protein
MKKFVLTLALAVFVLLGYGSVTEAKEISNDVVDLGVNTTTEAVTDNSQNSSGEDLKEWATSETVFGDDLVTTNVTVDGFFSRIYNKLSSALSGVQMVVAVILIMFFVIDTVMVVVSCFGQKNRVPWYLLAMLIVAIMFVCDIYAVTIVNAFKVWFIS